MARRPLTEKAFVIPIDATGKTILVAIKAEYNGTLLCAHGHPAISARQQFLHGQPNAFGGNRMEKRNLRSALDTCRAELLEESGDLLSADASFALTPRPLHVETTQKERMEFYTVPRSMVAGAPGPNPFYHTAGNPNWAHNSFAYQECHETRELDLSTLVKGASDNDIADALFDGLGLGAGHAGIANWLTTGTGKAMVLAIRNALKL